LGRGGRALGSIDRTFPDLVTPAWRLSHVECLDAADYAARHAEAQADLCRGRLADAELKFRALCEERPERSAGFSGLADVAYARSEWHIAVEQWQSCLNRFPDNPPLRWRSAHAWALLHADRPSEAEAAFLALCEVAPQDDGALTGLAHSAMRQERWTEAVELWDRLIKQFPDLVTPSWWLSLAQCLEAEGRFDEAFTAYADLLDAHPEETGAWRSYLSLLRRRDPDAAATAVARALQHAPGDFRLLLQASWIAVDAEDAGKARATLRSALTAAATVEDLADVFNMLPRAFVGWERTRVWLDLDERLLSLGSDGNPMATAALAMRVRLALRDYDGFLRQIEETPPEYNDDWIQQLRKITPRVRSRASPDYYAEKIFGIGLSRTGTTSLARSLEILGFHTAHYQNNFTSEILAVEDSFIFDSLCDTPVCIFFETLYHLFPKSKFIYTTRPLDSWLESINDHRRRVRPGEPLSGARRALENGSLWFRYPNVAAARQAFERRVRAFFAANDPTRLLEFDMFAGDGWEKLCTFVGRQTPPEPFPWENKASHREGT
jgi:tetratricopeptide (TPR) repeat protein